MLRYYVEKYPKTFVTLVGIPIFMLAALGGQQMDMNEHIKKISKSVNENETIENIDRNIPSGMNREEWDNHLRSKFDLSGEE